MPREIILKHEYQKPPSGHWWSLDSLQKAATIIAALAIPGVLAYFGNQTQIKIADIQKGVAQNQVDAEYIKFASSILSESTDPSKRDLSQFALRNVALELLKEHSDIRLTTTQQRILQYGYLPISLMPIPKETIVWVRMGKILTRPNISWSDMFFVEPPDYDPSKLTLGSTITCKSPTPIFQKNPTVFFTEPAFGLLQVGSSVRCLAHPISDPDDNIWIQVSVL